MLSCSPCESEDSRGQVINGDQSIIQLTVDLMGPWRMFLQTLSVFGTDILGSWSNLHIRSLDSELEVLRVGMAKWKPVPEGHNCESKTITPRT